jgi:hypothetical protein
VDKEKDFVVYTTKCSMKCPEWHTPLKLIVVSDPAQKPFPEISVERLYPSAGFWTDRRGESLVGLAAAAVLKPTLA